jgi:hypothetical protein
LHRLASRLGGEIGDLTPAHLQALCDLHMPEDVDLNSLSEVAVSDKKVGQMYNGLRARVVLGVVEDDHGGGIDAAGR